MSVAPDIRPFYTRHPAGCGTLETCIWLSKKPDIRPNVQQLETLFFSGKRKFAFDNRCLLGRTIFEFVKTVR